MMSARNGILAAVAAACAVVGAAGVTACSASVPARHAAGVRHADFFPAGHGPPTPAECRKDLGIACYSPRQVQRAYDLPPLYAKGFDGRGRTIVIVDQFGSPALRHDLAVFDRAFALPAPPSLRVLQPAGPVPRFNPENPAMRQAAGETALDVEWSHAIAPGASILLAETPGTGFQQFMAAENYVINRNLGDVISQTFAGPEQNFPGFPGRAAFLRLRYAYRNARRHHVTVVAASGDLGVTGNTPFGTYYQQRVVSWPASDPLVTGVGGTTLHLNAAGGRTVPDTAWNETRDAAVLRLMGQTPPYPFAGGGGLSAVFARPAYQDPVRGITGNHRGVPDVSMSASGSGSVLGFGSFTGAPAAWQTEWGTSEAAPEFAGIIAIADQYAHKRLGLINPALYRLEQQHAPGIVDITQGSNTVSFPQNGRIFTLQGYQAMPGYDLATGIGTINAALFVPELASAG